MLPADGAFAEISVEIEGLRQAAAEMRAELDKSFRVQVPKLMDAVQPGATLGGVIVGAEWIHLQDALHASLQATSEALFNLDLGTQAVTVAAERIAAGYGDADAFAHATIKDVNDVIQPPPPTPASTAAQPWAADGGATGGSQPAAEQPPPSASPVGGGR
jgi:hypothetical protein